MLLTLFFSRRYFLPFSYSFTGSWSLLLLARSLKEHCWFFKFPRGLFNLQKRFAYIAESQKWQPIVWRIPGTGEPGGLPSLGSHRVIYEWGDFGESDKELTTLQFLRKCEKEVLVPFQHEKFNFPYLSVPYNVIPVRYQIPWVSSPSLQLLILNSWP